MADVAVDVIESDWSSASRDVDFREHQTLIDDGIPQQYVQKWRLSIPDIESTIPQETLHREVEKAVENTEKLVSSTELDSEKERIFAQLSVEEEEDMMKFETDSETSSIAESNEEQQ